MILHVMYSTKLSFFGRGEVVFFFSLLPFEVKR